MTYTSIKFTDADGKERSVPYHHEAGATFDEISSFWAARLGNLDTLTKCEITGLQVVIDLVPTTIDPDIKTAPEVGSSILDEWLGMYCSTVAPVRPVTVYVPDMADGLKGTGGTVVETADLDAFVAGAITGGSGTGSIRLSDPYGQQLNAVREFRAKRANK